MSKQFRIFRNHYLCDDCPNEWSTEMMVVDRDYCPCCDRAAEPYDTESLLDDVIVSEEVEDADPDILRENRDENRMMLGTDD